MLVNLRLGLMGRELYCESEELAFVCDTTCMQVVLLLALV